MFNGVSSLPLEILEPWSKNVSDFRETTVRGPVGEDPKGGQVTKEGGRRDAQWQKPIFGVIKVNIDDA